MPERPGPGSALSEAERLLADGDPEGARVLLEHAAELHGVELPRLASALSLANRFLNRHDDTVRWIDKRLAVPHDDKTHVVLLQARIAALRQIDTRAVLNLADEALAAADAVGNQEAFANILAHAAFAAYRRGDPRAAGRFAALAHERRFAAGQAVSDGLRAEMFAAMASDALESCLALSRRIRERAVADGALADAANEHRNTAETLLRLGQPETALAEARAGAELSRKAGFRAAETFANALIGAAMCEGGDLDEGIDQLRSVGLDTNPASAADIAAALTFYLVERGKPGDAAEAEVVARGAVDRARRAGVSHFLTTLLATEARCLHHLGAPDNARGALAQARDVAEMGDSPSAHHLALAMAEILAPEEAARKVAVNQARARLLRNAGRREDPRAYCTRVRLHRRVLEVSGGVPGDLPGR